MKSENNILTQKCLVVDQIKVFNYFSLVYLHANMFLGKYTGYLEERIVL